jgi:uncharacterized membrane protein
MSFLKLFSLALPTFIALDLLWLGVLARSFYVSQLGHSLKTDVNWVAAIIFYNIYIFGLITFVLAPAMQKNSVLHAIGYGALFGLVCYATYDLTNLAVTKDWPVAVTVVDILWGAFVTSCVSGVTILAAGKLYS